MASASVVTLAARRGDGPGRPVRGDHSEQNVPAEPCSGAAAFPSGSGSPAGFGLELACLLVDRGEQRGPVRAECARTTPRDLTGLRSRLCAIGAGTRASFARRHERTSGDSVRQLGVHGVQHGCLAACVGIRWSCRQLGVRSFGSSADFAPSTGRAAPGALSDGRSQRWVPACIRAKARERTTLCTVNSDRMTGQGQREQNWPTAAPATARKLSAPTRRLGVPHAREALRQVAALLTGPDTQAAHIEDRPSVGCATSSRGASI